MNMKFHNTIFGNFAVCKNDKGNTVCEFHGSVKFCESAHRLVQIPYY